MGIRFSPCSPCCFNGYVAIVAGIYCTRIKCNSNSTLSPITYFPAQTVTLSRLGYISANTFIPDFKQLKTASINSEFVFNSNPGQLAVYPPKTYLISKYVDSNGNLKTADIQASVGYNLMGMPPLFLYSTDIGQDSQTNPAVYRIDYDLGKYGKFYQLFNGTNGATSGQFYYSLAQNNFPNQDPDSTKSPTGYQNVKYVCCPPCIVSQKGIQVSLSYDDPNVCLNTSGNYQFNSTGCYTSQDVVNGNFNIGTYNTTFNNFNKIPTILCKWNGTNWVSDPINICDWVTTEVFRDPYPAGGMTCTQTGTVQLTLTFSCNATYDSQHPQCSNGVSQFYSINGVVNFVNIMENGQVPNYTPVIFSPACPKSINTVNCQVILNITSGKSSIAPFSFTTNGTNITCNPMNGNLVPIIGTNLSGTPFNRLTGSFADEDN